MTAPGAADLWTWELAEPGPTPDVSIVICAHGRSDVTLECIRAVIDAQQANLTTAEVILVDDASPDDTRELAHAIRGLRVVALDTNVGFLRAANAGLAEARGTHVLFLNNDTLPVGRWLDPLVDTLDRRPRALVVGAKLVFPDGTLQEAGGIVFRDGSGWNYGRGMDPRDPRVTFERQVDYCSGAALLVRGDFLRGRGGFDARYAPAYYEDTDLCFAARDSGGEVWYQPRSVVVHLEGASHGTDPHAGVKAFQAANREVFAARWSAELARQHAPGARSVPSARQRSERGRIVVIDNEVPTPDRDSGSVRLTAVMSSMLELGYAVTFLPMNGWRREPYTSELERMGVEVLGVPDAWWDCIGEMRDGISHVWVSRPHVAEKVLPRVRALLPRARVIYDTVDLHFLRFDREAQLTGRSEAVLRAAQERARELEVMLGSDTTVVVSPHEADILKELTTADVRLLPNVHRPVSRRLSPRGRRDLLFVGGFRHAPNEDAVTWFVRETLPLIVEQRPGTRLRVVGSDVTPAIGALASESVEVLGWIPRLDPLYASARVVVAPLRFGAGVKGKVGEAMAEGVPVVMTGIAAEGMGITHGVDGLIADTPREFATDVLRVLADDDLWLSIATSGRHLVEQRFGVDAATGMLAEILQEPPSTRRTS